ncbi:MAG: hypothetical protein ACKVU2_05165 [Saprospiraceae bacterium]
MQKKRMLELSIYDEIAGFMAGMDPKKVVAFKPSEINQDRLDALLDKQREHGLTLEEKSELEHYLIINRIISLAKARALKLLSAA